MSGDLKALVELTVQSSYKCTQGVSSGGAGTKCSFVHDDLEMFAGQVSYVDVSEDQTITMRVVSLPLEIGELPPSP